MQSGRFAQTTVSRYRVNFDAAAARNDAVTFDASPVYLRSQVARAWISRWMPRAHLVVLVRNPVQRAFSHVTMGLSWMASKCTAPSELQRLEPLRPLLTFDKLMERSLIQQAWEGCDKEHGLGVKRPHSFNWLELPKADQDKVRTYRGSHSQQAEAEAERAAGIDHTDAAPPGGFYASSGSKLWDCMRARDAPLLRTYEDELLGSWPTAGERSKLNDAAQLLGHCSEMMLFPPGALTKGATYAEELERWGGLFPRRQLKV